MFPRWVFRIASIYGLVVMLPQYFLEAQIGRDDPPAITHPEYFYGFVGVALAWQVAFLVIAQDPPRYRPLMPVAMIEKASFGGAAIVLFLTGRLATPVLFFGCLDLLLLALFFAAWRQTRPSAPSTPTLE